MTAPSASEPIPIRQRLAVSLLWAALGAIATVAVLPYGLALAPAVAEGLPLSLPVFALAQAGQMLVLLFALSLVGLSLGQPLGLDSPIARRLVGGQKTAVSPRSLGVAALVGALAGAAIVALDAAFRPFMPAMTGGAPPTVALWKRALASLYGGITEELLLRLFLMTLIAWILCRVARRRRQRPPASVFWIASVLAAVAFGAGHLPMVSQLWPLGAVVVVRTIVLNAVGGVAFGYLYWRRGLEHAMLAHFSADIVIHVIGGS